MNLEQRLDNEIRLIEEDESLTNEEKSKLIKELYREARDIMRESNENPEY